MSSASIGLHVKYLLFLSNFNKTSIYVFFFRKGNKVPNFMKMRPVGTELFHADGQTDLTGVRVASRNFANAPETGRRSLQ